MGILTSDSHYPFSSPVMKAEEGHWNETSSYIANHTYVVFPLPVGPMMAFSPQGSSPLWKETKSSRYQIMDSDQVSYTHTENSVQNMLISPQKDMST